MLPALLRRSLSRRAVVAGVVVLMALSAGVTWQLFHGADIDLSIMTPAAHRPLVAVNGKVQRVPSGDYLDPTVLVDTTGCSDTNVIKWNASLTKFACGAGGTGGGITNTAPALTVPVSDGTNVGSSGIKDDSSIVSLPARKLQIGTVPVPSANQVWIQPQTGTTTTQAWIQEDDTGHVGSAGINESINLVLRNFTGHAMGTGGTASAGSLDINVNASKTSGTGTLTTYGILSNAQGGDQNYAFWSTAGDISMSTSNSAALGATSVTTLSASGATVDFSGVSTSVDIGTKVKPFKVPGSTSSNPHVELGTNTNDQFQLTMKNTVAANSFAGVEVAGDTTVQANIRPGYVLYRGAGGGIGGSVEGGITIASGGGFPFAQSTANSVGVFAESGQALMFGADSGFNASMSIAGDATGDVILMPGAPGISGHLRAQGAAVTLTNATCSSSTCNDIAGTITTTSTTATVTFNKTYTGANDATCIILPQGTATMPVCTESATAITCTTVINATKYNYQCVGH